MGKNSLSWSKLWNIAWWPGLKETRGPVAFTLLLLLSSYLLLELYLFLVVDSSPPGVTLPITTNTSTSPCHASPYCVITSKSLFLAPMDFYIHKPTAILLNQALNLDAFVSADFVSVSHILLAIFSARLIAHDSLCVRRVGVLLFELRNLFDSLDGVIARAVASRGSDAQTNFDLTRGAADLTTNAMLNKDSKVTHIGGTLGVGGDTVTTSQGGLTIGYFVDGICDGIGCIFLMAACLIYLQRHPHRKSQIAYLPLALVTTNNNRNGTNGLTNVNNNCKIHSVRSDSHHSTLKTYTKKDKDEEDVVSNLKPSSTPWLVGTRARKIMEDIGNCIVAIRSGLTCGVGLPAVLFLFQLLISSIFWNRNILIYAHLLEGNPADKSADISLKSNVIHSTIMWIVIYSWRIINPLNMTEALLIAIFFDRMADLLQIFQYSGFLIISCVSALSEIHHNDLSHYRNNNLQYSA